MKRRSAGAIARTLLASVIEFRHLRPDHSRSILVAAATVMLAGAFASSHAAEILPITSPTVLPWTTYQGNASHTGYVAVTLNPGNFKSKWNVPVGGGTLVLNPVTEADGMVYVTQDGYFSGQGLYVLNAATGAAL